MVHKLVAPKRKSLLRPW